MASLRPLYIVAFLALLSASTASADCVTLAFASTDNAVVRELSGRTVHLTFVNDWNYRAHWWNPFALLLEQQTSKDMSIDHSGLTTVCVDNYEELPGRAKGIPWDQGQTEFVDHLKRKKSRLFATIEGIQTECFAHREKSSLFDPEVVCQFDRDEVMRLLTPKPKAAPKSKRGSVKKPARVQRAPQFDTVLINDRSDKPQQESGYTLPANWNELFKVVPAGP